jgi:hypothetical protein
MRKYILLVLAAVLLDHWCKPTPKTQQKFRKKKWKIAPSNSYYGNIGDARWSRLSKGGGEGKAGG